MLGLDESQIEYMLSIVVPCYNCQSTLDRALDSLAGQTFSVVASMPSYQIVLVDDGSTDNTSNKCDYFSQKYSNVLAVHKTNGGLVDAWKTGVRKATGEYIAFCDSDDYIDSDFVQIMSKIITEHNPDMITFGMTYEYDNGTMICEDSRLEAGMFERNAIEKTIFPRLLSDGDMQSELVGSSRCNKVFRKNLLMKIVDDVKESVSFGEDDVTCFAAVLNASSIYSLRNYYPYHYVRNTESMIGAYDEKVFEKIDVLYSELCGISSKYGFNYGDQVEKSILSILFLYIKKEICKNPNGYNSIYKRVINTIDGTTFTRCYSSKSIKKYGLAKKMFAHFIANKEILLAYVFTKGVEKVRGRNV